MSEVTEEQAATGVEGKGSDLARVVLGMVVLLGLWAGAWLGVAVWLVWGIASFDSDKPSTPGEEYGGVVFLLFAIACLVAGPIAARKVSGRRWFLVAWPALGATVIVGMVVAAAT